MFLKFPGVVLARTGRRFTSSVGVCVCKARPCCTSRCPSWSSTPPSPRRCRCSRSTSTGCCSWLSPAMVGARSAVASTPPSPRRCRCSRSSSTGCCCYLAQIQVFQRVFYPTFTTEMPVFKKFLNRVLLLFGADSGVSTGLLPHLHHGDAGVQEVPLEKSP